MDDERGKRGSGSPDLSENSEKLPAWLDCEIEYQDEDYERELWMIKERG